MNPLLQDWSADLSRIGCVRELLEVVDADFVPPLSSRVELGAFSEKILRHACVRVVDNGVRCVALGAAYLNQQGGLKGAGYVTVLATHPEERGCGLGRSVMESLESEAVRQGIWRLFLQVDRVNVRAKALYERLGYVPASMGTIQELAVREGALILVKELGAAS